MAGRGTDIQLGGNLDMRVSTELKEVTDPAERERRIAQIKTEFVLDREDQFGYRKRVQTRVSEPACGLQTCPVEFVIADDQVGETQKCV